MRQPLYFKRHTLAAVTCYKQILDDECKCGLPANKLCLQLGLSRNTLQKMFKRVYGESIRDYKLRILMERSVELLNAGVEVTTIAEELNYARLSAFTNAFTSYYGYAPTNRP